jgi:predicted nucleic acid-binding protein
MSVFDASVGTALFLPEEPAHLSSVGWIRATPIRQDRLAVPSIALAEIAGAIARRTGNPLRATAAIAELRNTARLEIVVVAEPLAARAAEIAIAHRIRGCDAVYIALAEMRGEALVTLDREQLERGGAVVRVMTPEEALAVGGE